jgi:hypothetical protein
LLAQSGAEYDEHPRTTKRTVVPYDVPDYIDCIVKSLHVWDHTHCLLCECGGIANCEERQDIEFAIELEFRALQDLVFSIPDHQVP